VCIESALEVAFVLMWHDVYAGLSWRIHYQTKQRLTILIMKTAVKYAKQSPPLPTHFRRHSLWFVAAVLVAVLVEVLADSVQAVLLPVRVILMIPVLGIVVPYICYYLVAYPVIHAGTRHRGPNQSLWLGWLAVETLCPVFPLIRCSYFLIHILADIKDTGNYEESRK
jgi:hypothetical protein